jgi:phage terminase large subunit GpA-like protein
VLELPFAIPALTKALRSEHQRASPPPTRTVSQWADDERVLSPEIAAEAGRWKTSRVPYMREIMDVVNSSAETIVILKAAQIGATEVINNIVGYFVSEDPSTILIIQPTLELAEGWSRDRLAPMLRDTPVLRGLVQDARSRDSGNTVKHKEYPGGRITVVGANSPTGLRARSIRVVLADEVDSYPPSVGTEGDPLTLASARQRTFWNRKTILASTPLHKQTSVIWREWLRSDQRHFHVPCPHCGHEQILKWSNVRWDKTESGDHLPATAHYVCEECGAVWNDVERHVAVSRGRWIAAAPDARIAGFHISGLMSPWLTLEQIVREFLRARGDPYLMQVWSNVILGEPFEEERESIAGSGLVARCEPYGPESIPDGCRILCAGIDTQDDRLECSIVAFGARSESWLIVHEILHGDPALPALWDELDQLLRVQFQRQDGNLMRVMAACIDTGGHHAASVFSFCRAHRHRRIFPTKGVAGTKPIWTARSTRTGYKGGDRVFLIGVDTAKDSLYSRLRITKPGPGYVHFPTLDGIDENYFFQLVSEHVVSRKREGRSYRQWILPPHKRNEALDCYILAMAACRATGIRLDGEVQQPQAPAPTDQPVAVDQVPAARTPWLDIDRIRHPRGSAWWDRT